MSTDPKKDMYDHSYPESLNVAWDQFRTFEDSIRTFSLYWTPLSR